MQRRSLIQSIFAGAAGLIVLPRAGDLFAATPAASDIVLPSKDKILVSFGYVTDVHYCIKPTYKADDAYRKYGDKVIFELGTNRVYTHALQKLHAALDLMNSRGLDFAVELGDVKDCLDIGADRENTLAFLDTVEKSFSRFNGPRYHVAGNHDFDQITYEDYLEHTPNPGECDKRSYYSFIKNGVKFIVLDACYNSRDGGHYSQGNFDWTKAYIPAEELAWFEKELSGGTEPVIVISHQNLNYFDEKMFSPCVISNADEVVALMEKSGRVLMHLSGHHHPGHYSQRNGIHYVVAKGMVENELPHNTCGIVHVDADGNVYLEGFWDEASRTCSKA